MSDGRVILSWGPPRMGTTWLFNVLKAIARETGTAVGIVADHVDRPPLAWQGPVIIKSHRADSLELVEEFDNRVQLLACVMVRDAEPTFRSLIRTQTASRAELLQWLSRDLDTYERVLPSMAHPAVIREEWVGPRGDEIVFRLSAFLHMPLDHDQSARISMALDRSNVRKEVDALGSRAQWQGDFREFDPATQWHAGHVAPDDQPPLSLTPDERKTLEALQHRIDSLSKEFPLWTAPDCLSAHSSSPAMAFVTARDALLSRRSLASRARDFVRTLMGRIS